MTKVEKSDKESFILNMNNTEKKHLIFELHEDFKIRTPEKQWGDFFFNLDSQFFLEKTIKFSISICLEGKISRFSINQS